MLAVRAVALLATLMVAVTARAEGDPPVLPAGELAAAAAFELDLSRGQPHAPLWVVRGRYGVVPRLSLGAYATLPLTGRDSPLCGACDHPRGGGFADGSLQVLARGRTELAARIRLGSAAVDRFQAAVTLGGLGRAGGDRLWVEADPHVSIAITGRDDGNEDFIDLPLWLCGRAASWLRLYAHTGYRAPLTELDDGFYVALGAGAVIPFGRWEAGVEALFPRIVGPLNSGRIRTAFAFVRYRLPR